MKQCMAAAAGVFLVVCCLFGEEAKQLPSASGTPTSIYKLDGIIGGRGGFKALINRQLVAPGDPFGAGKVLAIEANRVTLEFTDGSTVNLRVGERAPVPAAHRDVAVPPAESAARPVTPRDAAALLLGPRKELFAYYPFNSNEGSRVSDLYDSRRDAIAENVEWTPLGKSGGALNFNGRDSFLTLPNPEVFNRLRAMTFSAWVNLRAMPSDFSGIASRRMPSELWWFGVKSGLGLQLYISGSGNGGDRTTGAGTLATGSWCHAVFTYEPGRSSAIYINGKPLNVVTVTGSLPGDEVTPVRIGRGVGPSETFDGIIDEVMIFDGALTAEEVARLYEDGKQKMPSASPKQNEMVRAYAQPYE